MMELDSSDKALLQRANTKLAEANTILQFLSEYFREKYGLAYGSQITPAGDIIVPALDGATTVPY
jgi:hypothetical protein